MYQKCDARTVICQCINMDYCGNYRRKYLECRRLTFMLFFPLHHSELLARQTALADIATLYFRLLRLCTNQLLYFIE